MRVFTRWKQARAVALLGVMAAMGRASPARARTPGDPAAAEQLFERGKVLLKEGDWTAACAKFQASMELDPAVGTLLKLAKCHEHEGKLARAWADYEAALSLNGQRSGQTEARRAELAEFATHAMAALRPRIPRLRIVLREKPPGVHVTRDGQALPAAALDEELPVDPGPVEIVVEAPGYGTLRRAEVVVEGQVTEVVMVLTPETFRLVTPDVFPRATPPPAGGDRWRRAAFYFGGAGVVVLGVAAGFGIDTLVKVGQSSATCDAENHCQPAGYDLRSAARTSQAYGFAALAVGAPLLLTGVVLFAIPSPKETAPRAALTVSPGSVAVRGAW
jgi:hypothetical protein